MSTAAYFPVWYTPESKSGETAAPEGEMLLWEIVQRQDMVVVFVLAENCARTQGEEAYNFRRKSEDMHLRWRLFLGQNRTGYASG
jgi:hypothetical protein